MPISLHVLMNLSEPYENTTFAYVMNTMAEPRDVPIKGIANIINSDIKAPFYAG